MKKEEILAKSRNENKNVLDEREKSEQTKANSLSQGIGLVLCTVTAIFGYFISGSALPWLTAAIIYTGTFAAERLILAIRNKNAFLWGLAIFFTLLFIAMVIVFILYCNMSE